MRGGLDDALDRLARMDQLRRRAEGASGGLPTAHGLAEAIEAVRRVVERHPDLNITLYGEEGEGSAEVRIGWEDGVVRAKVVSVEGPEGTSFGPGDGPLPVLPAEIPPITDLPRPLTADPFLAGRRPGAAGIRSEERSADPFLAGRRSGAGGIPSEERSADPFLAGRRPGAGGIPSEERSDEPGWRRPPGAPSERSERDQPSPGAQPVPETPRLVDPGHLADRRRRHAAPDPGFLPDPGGLAATQPSSPPAAGPRAWTEPAPADTQARPGDLPRRTAPKAWQAEHEDNPGAAARLAAMIREDPSLLASPEER